MAAAVAATVVFSLCVFMDVDFVIMLLDGDLMGDRELLNAFEPMHRATFFFFAGEKIWDFHIYIYIYIR